MYLLKALEVKRVPPRKHISGVAHSSKSTTLVSNQYIEGSTLRAEKIIIILSGHSLKKLHCKCNFFSEDLKRI